MAEREPDDPSIPAATHVDPAIPATTLTP